MPNENLSVTGRIVQGDIFEERTKDGQGRILTDKHGQPKTEYFVAIAVPKTDPQFNEVWAAMQQIAAAGFPGGQSQQADFSWKVRDGDLAANISKVGFAGHWIFGFTTGFAYSAYTQGAQEQLMAGSIKRGDYVRIVFTCKPNGEPTKPGVYLNQVLAEFLGHGEPIVGGPDAKEILAGMNPATIPAGASATPVAAGPPPIPGPAAPIPTQPPAPVPGPIPTQPPAPAPIPGPIQPATNFLNPAPPPAAAPAAGSTPGTMTAAAGGTTYEQYIGAGWTDDQLIQQGLMLP